MFSRTPSALTAVVLVLSKAAAAGGQETVQAPAPAPTPAPAVEYVGEVTGNRVYVRSGPDVNYYPVTQLDAGARVQVGGEAYGWVQILPPAGCYSLIDKSYVDRGTADLGVV